MINFCGLLLFLLYSLHSYPFTLTTTQKGWKVKKMEVNVNLTNCPSDILDRLDESFKLWNSIPNSSLKMSLGSTTSTTTVVSLNAGTATDTPVVLCDLQFGTNVAVDVNLISGYGFAGTYNNEDIAYGGLVLNVQAGAAGSINNLTTVKQSIVVAHELGHMLGLGHSSAEPSLMYFSTGQKTNLSLAKDDWDGISYLYPRDEVGQSNLAAGCGLIKNATSKGPGALPLLALLFLPFIVFTGLRFKHRIGFKNYILR